MSRRHSAPQDARPSFAIRTYGSSVFVGGEVRTPGAVRLSGPMDAMRAIIMAGGVLETARWRKVVIIRQMPDQGLNAPLMSGDGITDKEFVQIAGPGAEGTYMTFGPDARKNPNAKDVVAAFQKKGIDPEAYTLYSYAAVQILKQAAEQAKSLDGKKIADVMHSGG